jgi:NitT/TauT family transport system substrate-binding protein
MRARKTLGYWVVALCVLAGVGLASVDGWGAERVRLALPAKSMAYLPYYVAFHMGFFRDEGIDLEMPFLQPHIAHNALLGGEVEYHGVADSALRLAAKGAPMKAIFFGAAKPLYFLMSRPDLRAVPELKGKKVGVSTFGGTADIAARLALSHYGVDPQRDALVIMIGFENTRVQALVSGNLDATIVVPPSNVVLKQKGFNELVFLGDMIDFPSNGMTVSERRLKENRDQVKRMLRASVRGLEFAHTRAEPTIAIIEREWKVERQVAEGSYESVVKGLSKTGIATEAGLKTHIELMRKVDKSIGDVPFSKMVDFRPLEEVRQELGSR